MMFPALITKAVPEAGGDGVSQAVAHHVKSKDHQHDSQPGCKRQHRLSQFSEFPQQLGRLYVIPFQDSRNFTSASSNKFTILNYFQEISQKKKINRPAIKYAIMLF
jgi:hypothetical protein